MKLRNSVIQVLSILFLFCLSPQVEASDDNGCEATDSTTDVQFDYSTMNKKGDNEYSKSQGTAEADGQKKPRMKV